METITIPLILGIALPLIGFVVWLVRLEAKISENASDIARIEAETVKIWAETKKHEANNGIHYDERISKQVDKRYDEKFSRVEADIKEIKSMLKGLTDDIHQTSG